MSDRLKAQVAALQLRCDTLEARVIMLEDALYGGFVEFPAEWKLTRMQGRYLAVRLHRPGVVTKAMIEAAAYTDQSFLPDSKVMDVTLCNLRRKLEPFGIEIETIWGRGYRLKDQAAVKALAFPDVEERERAEASIAYAAGHISRNVLIKRMEATYGA